MSLGYETGLVTSVINKVSTCYTCNKSREAIFAGQTQVQALIKQSQFQNLSDDLRLFIFALPGGSSSTTNQNLKVKPNSPSPLWALKLIYLKGKEIKLYVHEVRPKAMKTILGQNGFFSKPV